MQEVSGSIPLGSTKLLNTWTVEKTPLVEGGRPYCACYFRTAQSEPKDGVASFLKRTSAQLCSPFSCNFQKKWLTKPKACV